MGDNNIQCLKDSPWANDGFYLVKWSSVFVLMANIQVDLGMD